MKLFDLFATISLDGKSFMSGLKSASSSFGSFASTISTGVVKIESTVEASVKRIGVAFVGLGSTLAATGLKYNSMMENYTADFTTLLQDATKAQQKVEELRKLDLVSPLDMNTLAGATKTMLSFGVAEDEVGSKLTELTDISMGNAERMNSLALAYAQIRSVGKLTMIDLRQMANQGFNPLKVVAEKTGVAIGDLQDFMSYGKPSELMQESIKAANEEVERLGVNASEGAKMLAQMGEEGQISADIVSRAITIATSEGGQYFKAAENAAKTLTGQLSMLKGGVNKLIGSGFQPMSEALTEDILPYMNQLIEDLDTAFNRHGGGSEGLMGMLAVVRDELIKMRDESDTYTEDAQRNIRKGSVLAMNTLKVFNGMLPTYLEMGTSIFNEMLKGIDLNLPGLAKTAEKIGPELIYWVGVYEGKMLEVGLEIISGIAKGINNDFGEDGEGKIQKAFSAGLSGIKDWIVDEENQKNIANAAVNLLKAFGDAVSNNAPEILAGAAGTIASIVTGGEKEGKRNEFANAAENTVGLLSSTLVAGVKIIGRGLGITSKESLDESLGKVVSYGEKIGNDILPIINDARLKFETTMGQIEAGGIPNVRSEEEIVEGAWDLTEYNDQAMNALMQSSSKLIIRETPITESINGIATQASEAKEEIEEVIVTLDKLDGKHVTTYWNMIGPMGGIFKGLENADSTNKDAHYVLGHATGLDYVPYDEYMARLHEGEAVLTKEEAKRWRRGEQDGGMMVVREEQNTRPIALYIDGQEVASVLYNQMNKRINNGNLQQIYGMGG